MGQTLTTRSPVSCGNIVGQQLVSAIREGDVDLVQRMISADQKLLNNSVFYGRQTPLHVAACHGQLEVLSMLLERGAEPNCLNKNGQTPLMLACKTGHSTCIELLLKVGANILGFDRSHGRTCLHYASRGGHTDCVRKILEGARRGPVSQSWGLARFTNVRDIRGMTALHVASRMGHASVVRMLLDNGSLVSATSTTTGNGPGHGSSPIHYAARGGSLDCVRELLAWGADRNQLDLIGHTPFGIAMKYSNTACAALLNPHAAEPLVWPSPWKFMSEGELEPEAKTVLEAALAQANYELDREIAAHTNQEAARKSSSRKKRSTLAYILSTPERPVVASPAVDSSLQAEAAIPVELPSEEARSSTVEDLPIASPDTVDTGGLGVQEMCCICFEHFCTIEVMECGHQMIGHLILARPKPILPEMKEKSKRKLRRSGGSKGNNSKGGSLTGSILNALGGSKRLGSSGRVADIDWLQQCGYQKGSKSGSSGRVADVDWLDRCGSHTSEASGRIADPDFLYRSGSLRLGPSSRMVDALRAR